MQKPFSSQRYAMWQAVDRFVPKFKTNAQRAKPKDNALAKGQRIKKMNPFRFPSEDGENIEIFIMKENPKIEKMG